MFFTYSNLTYTVSNLSTGYKIALGVAVFSGIVTLIASIIGAKTAWKVHINKMKADRFDNAKRRIDDAQIFFLQTSKDGKNTLIFQAAFDKLLGAYDSACSLVLDKKIDQNDFFVEYHQSIIQIVKNNPEKFKNPTNFQSLRRYKHDVIDKL